MLVLHIWEQVFLTISEKLGHTLPREQAMPRKLLNVTRGLFSSSSDLG